MTNTIRKILGFYAPRKQETDFSAFFHNASAREKKKLLTQVMRQANADQRALVDSYRKTVPSS